MSGGDGDDLIAKQKEFLDAFFKKGAELTEELLRENEKLRFRVVQLEEQLAVSPARGTPTPPTLKELAERIHHLEEEREQLLHRFSTVEKESQQYEARAHEIEHENNNLASLYVASYQLHSSLELREVLQTVLEILINFVGAKTFGVFFADDDSKTIKAVASEGVELAELAPVPFGAGVIGAAVAAGEARLERKIARGVPGKDEPAVCVPLRLSGRVVGAIAVWDFLGQKAELEHVDFEIFNLLGAHAANALEAARLAGGAGSSGFKFASLAERL
jgi:nitrate/nitrite-specific signal transduction histidine kinase